MTNYAQEQAEHQYNSIVELVENLKLEDTEAAREALLETPLSVEVRSSWDTPGDPLTPDEFQILLCTGGPAVRIVGVFNLWGEPDSATLQYRDWGTPWSDYRETDEATLLAFCREFYFGAD